MEYISKYQSPLGEILLAADEHGLTGLWFEGQKYYAARVKPECEERELPVFAQVKQWLTLYFDGQNPQAKLPLHFTGTAFQNEVWQIIYEIPYGRTMTYSEIAKQVAARRGLGSMAAQAVGSAVGRNRISVIVPCHRVVGADGNLTGYAGGMDRKIKLLKLEDAFEERFYVPGKRKTS